ncbi:MAG: ATP-binding cassette domain-containing protein, partial [Lachnospiraceae bacterium]|nr:ATP-binding cassette domain-containing protein [Lachnospiraceae bacterium]
MIQISNLGKRFGNAEVLKNISMHIEDGEIYGIIGHSGAGKSTLLRCMNGLEGYQSGSLKVMGKEVSALDGKSMREFRRDISMIFQNFNLLNRADVYHNVALPLQFAGENINSEKNKEKILKLLDMVGLSDKVHERPSNLSGGQKQRVAIAR